MIILAESKFSVSQVDLPPGGFADSRFEVDVAAAVEDSQFSVETIGAGALGLGPFSGIQAAHLVLTHSSIDRFESEFAREEPFSLSFSRDGITWQVSTHAFSGDEVAGSETRAWHGYEVDRGVAPPGADPIDFSLEVQIDPDDDTTVQRYPLITGGRAWESDRALAGHDPMQLGGGSYLSRFEGIRVDVFRKPAGEGRRHGQIITDHLLAVGIPASRIAISPALGHELFGLYERSCFEGIAEARTIAQAIGHFLIDDFAGNVVARALAPVEQPPVAEITLPLAETAEITSTITARARGVPTVVRIEGQRPIDPEGTAGFITTRRMESRITAPFTTAETFSQDVAGNVSSIRAAFTDVRITSETWIQETRFRDCLIQVRRETWEQFNPQKRRYRTASPAILDGDLPPNRTYSFGAGAGFIFGTGVTKDDSAPMLKNFSYVLHPVLVHQTDFLYDGLDGLEGAKIREIQSVAQWSTIEETFKASTLPSLTFEETVVRAGLDFFGGGRIIANIGVTQEVWFEGPNSPTTELGGTAGMGGTFSAGNGSLPGEPASMLKVAKWGSQVVTDIDLKVLDQVGTSPRELKVETRRVLDAEAYGTKEEGAAFWFRDVTRSKDPTQLGIDVSLTTRSFVNSGVAVHDETVISFDGKNQFVRQELKAGQPSHLPVAEICNAETQALDNTVKIFGRCEIQSFDLVPIIRIVKIGFGMEDEGAADEVACRVLRDATPLTIRLALPMSPLFFPGAPVRLSILHKGIDPDALGHASNVWVDTVELLRTRDELFRQLCILQLKLAIF